jgi:hypothetical protein
LSPEPRAAKSPSAIAPVPERAAAAILGSMIALILVLMAILAQTTWQERASATDVPAVETAGFAQR